MFPLDDIQLGAPAYGRRQSTTGVAFHSTESTGQDLQTAKNTALWQTTPGNSQGGSYNFLIGTDGILLSVPYLEASGGIAPQTNRVPRERYPWIPALIGEAAFADPNAHLVNVALSGRTIDFMNNGYPPEMVDQAARLVVWIEEQDWANDDLGLVGHYHFNSNRTDPGIHFIPLVLARYAELTGAPPTIPEPPTPTREERLAKEVTELRKTKPAAWAKWVEYGGVTQDHAGKPLERTTWLVSQVMYLRDASE